MIINVAKKRKKLKKKDTIIRKTNKN